MGKGKSHLCIRPKRLIVHSIDAFTLMIIVLVQGSILNYYIITHFKDSVTPYFLFAADLLCVATFIGTLFASYSYLVKVYACKDIEDGVVSKIRSRLRASSSRLGVMPLSYVSWLFYVVILITKIVVIFESGLTKSLSTLHTFGPQLLKVTIASSSFVFLLLVEGHNWVKRGLPRNAYVTTVCAKTAIEIFDSVSFLSILLEVPKDLGEGLKDLILALAALNFFLPSIKLYQLSFPDLSINKIAKVVTVIYMMAHIVLIDIPFLSVRLYLWLYYRENASMFLMKNILGIVLTIRGMYPELISFRHGFFTTEDSKSYEEDAWRQMSRTNKDENSYLTSRKGINLRDITRPMQPRMDIEEIVEVHHHNDSDEETKEKSNKYFDETDFVGGGNHAL